MWARWVYEPKKKVEILTEAKCLERERDLKEKTTGRKGLKKERKKTHFNPL